MKPSIMISFLCLISMNFVHGAPIEENLENTDGDKAMGFANLHVLDDESKEAAEDETHTHDHGHNNHNHDHDHDHNHHDIKIDPILNQEKETQEDNQNKDTEIEETTETNIERKKRQYYDHSHCYHDHCHDYYSDGHSHVRYGNFGGYNRGWGWGWGRRRWNYWG